MFEVSERSDPDLMGELSPIVPKQVVRPRTTQKKERHDLEIPKFVPPVPPKILKPAKIGGPTLKSQRSM